ncbi:MAG: FAD-dependent thymidylate synthase [Actinomycetota bacterium]
MRETTPQVELIARPSVDLDALERYLKTVGGESWLQMRREHEDGLNPGQLLIEAGGRLCFDDQTDILTTSGWKRFADLEVGEEVATLNRHTLLLEYQPVLACWRYPYVGDMYEVAGRDVSFSVTPEHRLWASLRTLRDRDIEAGEYFAPFRFHTAETIGLTEFKVMTAANGWKGRFPEEVVIPDVHWSQRLANGTGSYGRRHSVSKGRTLHDPEEIWALVLLLVYYATEGSVKDHEGSGRGLVIYGDHEQGVREACDKLGLTVGTGRDPRNGVKRMRVSGGLPLVRYVVGECGLHSRNKRLPRWILDLPQERLQDIWDLLVETDGSQVNGRKKVTTTSPALVDACQEILVKLGRASSVVRDKRDFCNVFEKLPRPATINRVGRTRMQRVPFDGDVFCCTTANGIVLVRRRGLIHFSGNCYRSWKEGLNPNVTRIRRDQKEYFLNLLRSGHGSVLEHANYSFLIWDVSRIFTHETIRHRAGSAFSQESLRFVRLEEIPFRIPEILEPLRPKIISILETLEEFQISAAQEFGLDEKGIPFHHKKEITSALRRLGPMGVSTAILWTANIRTLRHVIQMRTDPGAEEELRFVFNKIGEIMKQEAPLLFGDFVVEDGAWTTEYRKV